MARTEQEYPFIKPKAASSSMPGGYYPSDDSDNGEFQDTDNGLVYAQSHIGPYSGAELPPGWEVDSSNNYVTNDGWLISQDQSKFKSPDGEWYTKEDIQKSKDLQLNIAKIFPDTDIKQLSDWAETDPQKFVEQFQQAGDTPLSRSVLAAMGLDEADIIKIFQPAESSKLLTVDQEPDYLKRNWQNWLTEAEDKWNNLTQKTMFGIPNMAIGNMEKIRAADPNDVWNQSGLDILKGGVAGWGMTEVVLSSVMDFIDRFAIRPVSALVTQAAYDKEWQDMFKPNPAWNNTGDNTYSLGFYPSNSDMQKQLGKINSMLNKYDTWDHPLKGVTEFAISFFIPMGGEEKALGKASKFIEQNLKSGMAFEQILEAAKLTKNPDIYNGVLKILGKTERSVLRDLGKGKSLEKVAANLKRYGMAETDIELILQKAQQKLKPSNTPQGIDWDLVKTYTSKIVMDKVRNARPLPSGMEKGAPLLNDVMPNATWADKWRDIVRKFEDAVFDKYYQINQYAGKLRGKGAKIMVGDAELEVALIAGSSDKGMAMAETTFNKIKAILGDSAAGLKNFSQHIFLKRQMEILAQHPTRVVPGMGNMTLEGLQNQLNHLRAAVGDVAWRRMEQAATVFADHYRALLQAKVEAGIDSKETAALLDAIYPGYYHTYYIEQLYTDASKIAGRTANLTKSDILALNEKGLMNQTVDPLNALLMDSIRSQIIIGRNRAAQAIARMVETSGLSEQFAKLPEHLKGTITYLKDGKQVEVVVSKALEKEAKNLYATFGGWAEKVGDVMNKMTRLTTTTLNIAFFLPNLAVDGLTAFMAAGVTPLEVGGRLMKNIIGIFKDDPLVRQYRMSRAGMGGMFDKSISEIIRDAEKGGGIVLNKMASKGRLWKPWELISELSHAIELAPRTAVFEKLLKSGMSAEEAALAARRATIDFSRGGYATQWANHFYLYLNAGMQGFAMPFRLLAGNPAARMRLAGLIVADAGLYWYNQGYPEYADVPDYIKYGSLVFMLPSDQYNKDGQKVPHYLCLIPNLREWSMFHGLTVYAFQKLQQKTPDDFGQFFNDWFPNINPLTQMLNMGVPQAGEPITAGGVGNAGLPMPVMPTQPLRVWTDVASNHDSLRNRPIVPDYLLKEYPNQPSQQYDDYTTRLGIWLGSLFNISPKLIDYTVYNLFGGVGGQIMDTIDFVMKQLSKEDKNFDIQQKAAQLKAIQDSVPREMKGKSDQEIGKEIVKRRTEFLNSLTPDERKAVLEEERAPQDRIPLLSTILNRVYKEKGGQLKENAARELVKEKLAPKTGEAVTEDDYKKAEEDYRHAIEDFNAGRTPLDAVEKARQKYHSFRSGYLSATYKDKLYPSASELREKLGTEPTEFEAMDEYFKLIDKAAEDNRIELAQTGSAAAWERINKEVYDKIVEKYGQDAADYVIAHRSDYLSNLDPELAEFEKLRAAELDQGTWFARARKQGVGMQSVTPKEIAKLYKQYTALGSTADKNAFRRENPALDEWLTEMGYTPLKPVTHKLTFEERYPTSKDQIARFRVGRKRFPSKRMTIKVRKKNSKATQAAEQREVLYPPDRPYG